MAVRLLRDAATAYHQPVRASVRFVEPGASARRLIAMTRAAAPASSAPPGVRVLTVTELTAALKSAIEEQFSSIWVAGEISNFSQPQSGHCYFTLKDDAAQLRAVMWRQTAARQKFELRDGLEVVCCGRLDVYGPRGTYQLVVEEMQPRGVGALELALRQLRDKLAKEGLFDPQRKRPLPRFPRRIGVVTSPTGAAIRDFLEVLRRRWRGVEVLILPTRVQGEGAAAEIAAAIRTAQQIRPTLDVLIATRGGGSLEDLWCFNEEPVVRALAESRIPTISAIGHEIDVTLSDLAADVRALTPSEAAERVVPSADEAAALVTALGRRMQLATAHRVARLRSLIDSLASRPVLARPLEGIQLRGRRLDELAVRIHAAMQTSAGERRARLAATAGKLESLSPLAVLGRGYSVTLDAASGRAIQDAAKLKAGQRLVTRFAQGSATSVVETLSYER